MKNVIIKNIARVTGSRKIHNNELVQKYSEEYGLSEDKAKRVLEDSLGREVRHVIKDSNMNTLLLGANAVDKLLESSDVKSSEIDLLLFASQFPEYTCPTQSALIHKHCKISEKCFTLDINANCSSGLYGISVARNMLLANENNFKYAIVIASDLMSTTFQEGNLVTEGCFGDAGLAVLLEVVDTDEFVGLSNSKYATTDEAVNNVFYPECGGSGQHLHTGDSTRLSWENPDYPKAIKFMGDNMCDILDNYGITKKMIDWICCSQFTEKTGLLMADMCEFDSSKLIYVGNKYGYTGVSSPLMAYCDALEDGRIKRGNIIGLTTIGLGGQSISMFYKQQ